MKWLESRILWGGLLIIGGVLFLLQNLGVFEFGDLFWAVLFFLAGLFFISLYRQNRANWWALIPGFALFGVGAQIAVDRLFPQISDILGGLFVLGFAGLGFLVIYLLDRENWWAIIPGGVLTGIGLGILAQEGRWFFPAADQEGVFLVCFALGWFLITALTALFTKTQWWALIPGGIMTVIGGSILATNGAVRWEDLNLVYAVILISAGLILLAYKGRAKKSE